jgi:hypothetical protein
MSKLMEAFEKLLAVINASCFNPAAFASMFAISWPSLNASFTWLKQAMEVMRKDIVRMTFNGMYWVLKKG